MSIERIFYCDCEGCERHARTAGSRPESFFTITEGNSGHALHFCSWDCILKRAAEVPPMEVVPAGQS